MPSRSTAERIRLRFEHAASCRYRVVSWRGEKGELLLHHDADERYWYFVPADEDAGMWEAGATLRAAQAYLRDTIKPVRPPPRPTKENT